MLRRVWLAGMTALTLVACGGPPSTLRTLGTASGQGPARLAVQNLGDALIARMYLARTERVRAAGKDAWAGGEDTWGADLLARAAIQPGATEEVQVERPGRYDCRLEDNEGRYQHIQGLALEAGGRYRLEVHDGGWRIHP